MKHRRTGAVQANPFAKKSRRIFWISAIVVVVVAVVLAGGWIRRRNVRAEAEPQSGQVVTAFIGDLATTVSASGQWLPKREAQLSLAVAGRVEQVLVEAGEDVREGDVLVRLDDNALQQAVRKAEQNLIIQEANLAQLRRPAREEEIAAARATVLSAKAQLDDLLAGPGDEELADAEAALASAQAQLADLLAGPGVAPLREELVQARAALASAQAAEKAAAARYAAIEDQLTVARQQLDLAQVDLESARYFYDALANDWQHKDYAPFSPEAKVLQDAQTAYDVALARYRLTAAEINDSAVRSAQAQVAQAQANLAALPGERGESRTRIVEIAAAREQVALAEANLAALTGDQTSQIASAGEQLAQAEANLANLVAGASPEKLVIAEAQVEQARIALASAQARLADAVLRAPFDGLVTAVHVSPGEWASGLAVELADVRDLEVVIEVDEVDMGTIAVGQPVTVTLEAWPDRAMPGQVADIAPGASAQSDVVTYQVRVALNAGELPVPSLRLGMTANADVLTLRREDLLLVPNRAIIADRKAGKYYVNRVEGEAATKVEVTIGARDSTYTEIVGGLRAGDMLRIVDARDTLAWR